MTKCITMSVTMAVGSGGGQGRQLGSVGYPHSSLDSQAPCDSKAATQVPTQSQAQAKDSGALSQPHWRWAGPSRRRQEEKHWTPVVGRPLQCRVQAKWGRGSRVSSVSGASTELFPLTWGSALYSKLDLSL